MRLAGIFFTALVVLAAAQAIATALAILLMAALLYGLCVAPRETLGFLALLLIAGLFKAHPVAFLGVVAVTAVAKVILN